ncbi:MAG TPA: peptide chain release factor N(5)-glutamine methyltransferase [Spirochaetia bacterium]|nr:peptide chain release factor N(5)-glutamine methyltransferase [Spirochaetia bacterium]
MNLKCCLELFRPKKLPDFFSFCRGMLPDHELLEIFETVCSVKAHDIFMPESNALKFKFRLRIFTMINRRRQGNPLAYITGKKHFFEDIFFIKRGVLVPRPETGELLEYIIKDGYIKTASRILDIGCGSGVIAITLKKKYPEAEIWGIDKSAAALSCAAGNERHILGSSGIYWQMADILRRPVLKQKFRYIVSNPPYVTSGEYRDLPDEIRKYEPPEALQAGKSGLVFYYKIRKLLPMILEAGGSIFLETGFRQGDRVRKIFEGEFRNIRLLPDLQGHSRFVFGLDYETHS